MARILLMVLVTLLMVDTAVAQVVAAAPATTPGDNAWQQVWNFLVENGLKQLMGALSVTIASLLAAAMVRWFKKLGIEVTQAQQAQLQDAAIKSLQWAIMRGLDLIEQKGWDHPDVQQVIMKDAVERMKSAFPDVVDQTAKTAGIEKEHIDLVLHPVVLRLVPQAFAQAAASPATPPVPVDKNATPVNVVSDASEKR